MRVGRSVDGKTKWNDLQSLVLSVSKPKIMVDSGSGGDFNEK